MPENDFDFEAIAAEFDATYSEEATEEVEEVEETEETEEVTEDNHDNTEEIEQNEETSEETEEVSSEETTAKENKSNQAFAELRRKAAENEKAADFLNKLANQSGMTPEEVLKRFEKKQLEDTAQKNGVPVEVMERIQKLEQENSSFKEENIAQKMDTQINDVISKYSATEEEIQATFEEMFRAGVDPRENPNADFEKFYKAAHFDKILEAKVNESKQESLSQKKKRQQQAAIPNGTSVTQTDNSDTTDLAKQDAADILANW